MITFRSMANSWLALALCAAGGLAHADFSVGRISALQGGVSAQTPGDPASHRASANDVVAEGDQLATGADAGVELQFAGVVLEIGPSTVIALTRVQTDGFAVFIDHGSVALGRSNDDAPANVTLQGNQIVAYAETAGRYRLDVDPEGGDEHLSVWLGRVSAQVDSRELQLFAGQSLDVSQGLAGSMAVSSTGNLDQLDMILADRLGLVRASASTQRLSSDWVGAAALDDQGSWLEVSSVGPLWVPFFLPDNWAPYRSGHWAWNGVWGWSWVDDLPWSYVSFHFGRWIWWNNRWAWSPNGRVPLFSPAGFCPPGLRPPPLPNRGRLANVLPAVLAVGPGRRAGAGSTGIVASVLSRPRAPGSAPAQTAARTSFPSPSGGLRPYETVGANASPVRPAAQPRPIQSNTPLLTPALSNTSQAGAAGLMPRHPAAVATAGPSGSVTPAGVPVFTIRPPDSPYPAGRNDFGNEGSRFGQRGGGTPRVIEGGQPLMAPPALPSVNPALTSGAVPLAPPLRLPSPGYAANPGNAFASPALVGGRSPSAIQINANPGTPAAPAFAVPRPMPSEGRSAPREENARGERPTAGRIEIPDGQRGPGHSR